MILYPTGIHGVSTSTCVYERHTSARGLVWKEQCLSPSPVNYCVCNVVIFGGVNVDPPILSFVVQEATGITYDFVFAQLKICNSYLV